MGLLICSIGLAAESSCWISGSNRREKDTEFGRKVRLGRTAESKTYIDVPDTDTSRHFCGIVSGLVGGGEGIEVLWCCVGNVGSLRGGGR